MLKILTLAIVGAVTASPAAAAVNLVVNGGFEAPALSPGGFNAFGGGTTIGNWLAPAATVGFLHTSYSEGGLVFNSRSGAAALELTGAGNTGPTAGVSQIVATGFGTYRLQFYVGNASPTGTNAAVYGQPSTVKLSINGGPATTFANADNTPFGINWRQFSVVFAATGPTNIAFLNGTSDDNYAGLDDVTVTAVPEPASWALLIAGFGLTGAVMRRQRRIRVDA